jgi:hypothetical protein
MKLKAVRSIASEPDEGNLPMLVVLALQVPIGGLLLKLLKALV